MAFEPKIVAFLCNWCTYTGADLAGVSRLKWPPNVRPVRVMCSGRIDPQFVVKAFQSGADGVLISGCHPGDCHYYEGNYKALRRVRLMKRMLKDFGIHPERLKLTWVSAAEADRWVDVAKNITETVRQLGPLELNAAV
jgi:F420-non-reducing hydrogenase iron-sulfur subunit